MPQGQGLRYSDVPPYMLWGPILQDAIIDFIERFGWQPEDTLGYWTHRDHPKSEGYLRAFEITRDWLLAADEGDAP